MIRVIDNYSGLPNGYLLINFHTDLKYYKGVKVTGKGFQWITYVLHEVGYRGLLSAHLTILLLDYLCLW